MILCVALLVSGQLILATSPAAAAAPTVTAIAPTSGTVAGGTAVTITGTFSTQPPPFDFIHVFIGGIEVTAGAQVSATSITATTPAHAAGAVDVVVVQRDGTGTCFGCFTYIALADFSLAVSPASVTVVGGGTATYTVAITRDPGSFTGAVSLFADRLHCPCLPEGPTMTFTPNPVTGSSSTLTITNVGITTPPGTYQFMIYGTSGTLIHATSATLVVTAATSPPTVTAISPNSGSTGGGTAVTIIGSGFVAGTTVTIGGAATSVVAVSATSITAQTPIHAAGAVDIVVTNANGSGTCLGCFTYVAPTVTAISPSIGSISGGTPVTITGTGFVAGDSITIGGAAATNVAVINATTINAKTAAHAAGAVNVVVADRGGSGTCTGCYTYDDSRQDGDLFVGSASYVDGFGNTAGGVWRVRGSTPTLFCSSPLASDDPGFWNVPNTLIVDSKGRIVFLAPLGQEMGLLRCDQIGQPAERLGVIHLRHHLPAGWPDPFPNRQFGTRMGYLHVLAQRMITDDLTSLPKVNNEDSYEFVVQAQVGADPNTPGPTEMLRYGADTGTWQSGRDLPEIVQSGNLVSVIPHGADLWSFNGSVLRRTSLPLNLTVAGTAAGVDFKLTYQPFGGVHELAGAITDDTTVPNVSSGCNTDPPGRHDEVTDLMPYQNGFGPLGADRVIYDEHGDLGLVLRTMAGYMPGPYMTHVRSALLNDDPTDDMAGYFHQPFAGCVHVPWVQFAPILPYTSPGSAVFLDNVADVIATAPGGMVGTSFWGNKVLRLTPGDKAREIVTLYHPGGIAAYPAIVPSIGTVVYVTVHSPVDVLLTDAAGRRIGVDPLTRIAVNDFGQGGFDSGPGEPRVFAIKDPSPGAFTLSSIGTGTGAYTIDVASADLSSRASSRITTTGIAAVGVAARHDFVLGAASAVQFTAPTSQPTTTSLSTSVNPSLVHQAVTVTAMVTSATGIPSGSLRWTFRPTIGAPVTFPQSLDATGTVSALLPAALSANAGAIQVTAEYLGTAAFAPSSDTFTQVVRDPATVTTVVSAPAASVFGQAVTLTATVIGGDTPTGIVTFKDGGTTLGTATLVGGQATLLLTTLEVGDHAITATYGGSATSNASTSVTLTHTVRPAATTTVVISATQPSVFGQPVTWTATVSAVAPGAGMPVGTVTFTNGAAMLGSQSLSAGQASVTSAALMVGSNTITASYGGDPRYAPSTGTVDQSVAKAATTTVAVSSGPTVFGQAVTVSAAVIAVAPGAGTPTGTVTVFDGTTIVGTAAASGGLASIVITTLPVGAHLLTASYSGDASFQGSTSPAITQTVAKADTTTVIGSSGPTVFGQPATFTATVSAAAPGAGTPTGTVTFTDGTTVLGAGTLVGGIATFTTATLDAGTHAIAATYSGSGSFLASAATPLAHTVTKAPTTTTVTSGPPNPSFGQPITFTATVRSTGGVPTGSVTFTEGATVLGSGTLSGGVTTFTIDTLAAGSHSITAAYGGGSNFLASVTATPLAQTIDRATTTLDLTFDTSLIEQDNWVALTVTVRPAALAGSTVTGTVEFIVTAPDGTITRTVASVGLNGIARSRQRFQQQAGTYRFSAVFSSTNPNFKGASDGPITITVGQGTQARRRGGPAEE